MALKPALQSIPDNEDYELDNKKSYSTTHAIPLENPLPQRKKYNN